MENYCILCGSVLEEGMTYQEEHQFKKMCLNCSDSIKQDDGSYVCGNELNKQSVMEKMLAAANGVTESYSIDKIEISPLPLKKPTSKCKQWTLDEVVLYNLSELFK